MNYKEFPIAMGTVSGTFLSTIAALKAEDIFVTAILAILGAVISFILSCLLNIFIKPRLKKLKPKRKKS
ncbi:MAG: hypothetical protein Q8O88_05610 [bacterium]|nr:hypothetical protein [bacterium]